MSRRTGTDPAATQSAPGPAVPAEDDRAPLEWTVDPWRERARRAVLAVTLTVGLASLAFWISETALTGFAFALFGFLWLCPAFFAAHCRVDEAGVTRRMLGLAERRRWTEIRGFELDRNGVFVSPASSGMLGSVRGLRLPLPVASERRGALWAELRERASRRGL